MAAKKRKRSSRPPSLGLMVEEALESVLSPLRSRKVLGEALDMAGLPAVPETQASLQVFVEGALFAALSRQLDISNALEVLTQLRASLDHAFGSTERTGEITSDIRAKREVSDNPRTVLVATQASLVVFLLQDMLGDEVEILPVSSEGELVDRLRRVPRSVLLVVDRKHPVVGPHCARHLTGLRDGSTLIWWGGAEHEQLMVEAKLGESCQLIPTQETLTLADLGEMCRGLVRVG